MEGGGHFRQRAAELLTEDFGLDPPPLVLALPAATLQQVSLLHESQPEL